MKSGFTMMELLVVMVIIGILAEISYLTYNVYLGDVYEVQCAMAWDNLRASYEGRNQHSMAPGGTTRRVSRAWNVNNATGGGLNWSELGVTKDELIPGYELPFCAATNAFERNCVGGIATCRPDYLWFACYYTGTVYDWYSGNNAGAPPLERKIYNAGVHGFGNCPAYN